MKISKGIGILSNMRHFVPIQTMRNLYFTFAAPHVNYALINWGCAASTLIKTIQRKLNKALRIISFEENTTSAKPIFKQLGILNFEDSFYLECAKLMYDIKKNSHNSIFS